MINIIKKNFKLLIRSKGSALIVILAPLLVIFLVGIAFDNSNTYALNIGVYSSEYSELSESIVQELVATDYNIERFTNNKTCVDNIKMGLIHTCIGFPPKMNIDKDDVSNEIVFHVDYSKINLVWMIIDTLSNKLSETSDQLSMDLTGVILNKLKETRVEVSNDKPIVVDIKTGEENLNKEINKIYESLDKLDLKIGIDEFNITTMRLSSETQFKQLNRNISKFINRTRDAVARIERSNNGSGLQTYFNKIDNAIEGLENETDYQLKNWTFINTSLAAIETNLNSVSEKLKQAETTRDDITKKKKEITTKVITSNLENIEKIKESLDKINENIGAVKITSAEKIVNPITTRIEPITSEETHLNYLFPSLLVLVIMFISILLATTLVMMEKHSPAYFRNFTTPTGDLSFIFATFFTTLVIILFQVVIMLGISAYFFSAKIIPSLLNICIVLLIIISMFTFLGMIIGYIFRSEETGIIAAVSTATILLFVSDMILPLESVPRHLLNILMYNPFVIAKKLMKQIIIFNEPLKNLMFDVYILLGIIVAVFIFTMIYLKLTKKHFVQKLLHSRYRKAMKREQQNKKSSKKAIKKIEKFIQKAEHALEKNKKKKALNEYNKAFELYSKSTDKGELKESIEKLEEINKKLNK